MKSSINNVSEFKDLISKNGVVFVEFFATWCGPCKMLYPLFKSVELENPNLPFVTIDIDEFSELAQEYDVSSVPLILVFKNGKVDKKSVGFIPKQNIQNLVNEFK